MEEKKCLKCGRPCSEDQVFCGECLAEMEKYPVKPGVVVLLPQREPSKPVGRRRFTPPSPEEQIVKLKKQIVALRVVLFLALGAIGVLGWLTTSEFFKEEDTGLLPGQNYSSETNSGVDEIQ